MVPSIMLHTVHCPVCGCNISVNNKRQLVEHKKNGQLCYGSFMPEVEPKFLEPPKTQQNFIAVGGHRYVGGGWQNNFDYGSSLSGGNEYVAVSSGPGYPV